MACASMLMPRREGGASRKPKSVRKGVKTPREARPSLSAALRDKYKPKEGQASQVIYVGSDDEDGPPTVRYRESSFLQSFAHTQGPRSASPAEGDPTGGRIDRTIFKNAPREPKYLPPYDSFPDEVAHSLRSLRRASTKRESSLHFVVAHTRPLGCQQQGQVPRAPQGSAAARGGGSLPLRHAVYRRQGADGHAVRGFQREGLRLSAVRHATVQQAHFGGKLRADFR